MKRRRIMACGTSGVYLPQWVQLDYPTVLEDFEVASDFTVVSGSTPTDDLSHHTQGNASMRITNAGALTKVDKTYSPAQPMTGYVPRVEVDIYKHAASVGGITIPIFLSQYSNFSKSKQVTALVSSSWPSERWYHCTFFGSAILIDAGYTFAAPLQYLRVQVSGTANDVSIDNLTVGRTTNAYAAAMFSFDDGWATQYSYAFPIFQQRRVRATVYLISNLIGTDQYMTAENARTMQAGGWLMANHTTDHNDLVGKTLAEQESRIAGCDAALAALGINGGKHLAFPYGHFDANTLIAMNNLGILTGRATISGLCYFADTDLQFISCYTLSNTTSLAAAKSYVDAAVSQKKGGAFLRTPDRDGRSGDGGGME